MKQLAIISIFLVLAYAQLKASVIINGDSVIQTETTIFPVAGVKSAVSYYSYGTPFAASANLPLSVLKNDSITTFIYTYLNSTYLFVVFDKPNSGGGSSTGNFSIYEQISLTPISNWSPVLQDDVSDSINAAYQFKFDWSDCCTDGFVFGGLTPTTDFCIQVNFKTFGGLKTLDVMSLDSTGDLVNAFPSVTFDSSVFLYTVKYCGNVNFLDADINVLKQESCPGAKDGLVSIAVQGNNPPFTVNVNGDIYQLKNSTNGVYVIEAAVSSGPLTVIVTDSTGKTITKQGEVSVGVGSCNNVDFEWVGQSTQIKLFQRCDCNEDRWLKIKFESIEEINSKGRVVQKVSNFANAGLELKPDQLTQRFGVDAKLIQINGPVRIAGSKAPNPVVGVKVWYFFDDVVNASINGDEFNISARSIKWDIDISGWPFEDAANFLRFNLDILTPGSNTAKIIEAENGVTYEYIVRKNEREPARIFVPNEALVDGVLTQFPATVRHQGSHTYIQLDFPYFSSEVNYDPLTSLPARECGNGVLDAGEQCDYGSVGCNAECKCVAGYTATGTIKCRSISAKLDSGVSMIAVFLLGLIIALI